MARSAWLFALCAIICLDCAFIYAMTYEQEVEFVRSVYQVLDESNPDYKYNYISTCSLHADSDRWYKVCNCGTTCNRYGDCCKDAVKNNSLSTDTGSFDSRPVTIRFRLNNDASSTNSSSVDYQGPFAEGHDVNVYVKKKRCPDSWLRKDVKDKCELAPPDEDNAIIDVQNENLTAYVRVTVKKNNLTYPNVFCALCNGESDYRFWDAVEICALNVCNYFFRPNEEIYFNLPLHLPRNFSWYNGYLLRSGDGTLQLKIGTNSSFSDAMDSVKFSLFSRYFQLKEHLAFKGYRELPAFVIVMGEHHAYENIGEKSRAAFDNIHRPIYKLAADSDLADVYRNHGSHASLCKAGQFHDPLADKKRSVACHDVLINDGQPSTQCDKFNLAQDEVDVTYSGLYVPKYGVTLPWLKFALKSDGSADVCLQDML